MATRGNLASTGLKVVYGAQAGSVGHRFATLGSFAPAERLPVSWGVAERQPARSR